MRTLAATNITTMKKTLVIGDIHGRTLWKDLLKKEAPEQVVMLGDYVSSHEYLPPEEQIRNLEEILELKEQRPEDIILLRGNHDLQHLGYWWAECSHLSPTVQRHMADPERKERFLSLTRWVHELEAGGQRILCSHAGVSKVWMERAGIGSVADINACEPDGRFGFTPGRFSDHNGESTTQPCTWIRPASLTECAVDGYVHVVGHTPQETVTHERINDHTELWLVDALAHGSYLVLEENGFTVKQL